MKKIVKLSLIAIIAINMIACEKKTESDILFVEGTVIGSYVSGIACMLVQVNTKYPIGKSVYFTENMLTCYNSTFNNPGLYHNLIQVQRPGDLNFVDRDDKYTIGSTFLFSYREYNSESDWKLFEGFHRFYSAAFYNSNQGDAERGCSTPNVPVYVITDYTILK